MKILNQSQGGHGWLWTTKRGGMRWKWKTGWWVIRGITLWKWVEKWFTGVGMVLRPGTPDCYHWQLGCKDRAHRVQVSWRNKKYKCLQTQLCSPKEEANCCLNPNNPVKYKCKQAQEDIVWSLTIYLRNCKAWQCRKNAVFLSVSSCLLSIFFTCLPSKTSRHTLNSNCWLEHLSERTSQQLNTEWTAKVPHYIF